MRTLPLLLALLFLAPASAVAQDGGLKQQIAEAKALREAIKALPKDDPAVGYARSLQLEGRLLVGGGAALGAAGLVGALIEVITPADGTAPVAPAFFGASLGAGLGLVAAGLPTLLDGSRFQAWYATHPHPPSALARLRLLHRWRVVNLRSRMLGGVIGGATLGGIALISTAVWVANDAQGQNTSSAGYDATDAGVSLGFLTGAIGAGVSGVISGIEFQREKRTPHRLYKPLLAVPTASAAPVAQGRGVAVSFGVVGVF